MPISAHEAYSLSRAKVCDNAVDAVDVVDVGESIREVRIVDVLDVDETVFTAVVVIGTTGVANGASAGNPADDGVFPCCCAKGEAVCVF